MQWKLTLVNYFWKLKKNHLHLHPPGLHQETGHSSIQLLQRSHCQLDEEPRKACWPVRTWLYRFFQLSWAWLQKIHKDYSLNQLFIKQQSTLFISMEKSLIKLYRFSTFCTLCPFLQYLLNVFGPIILILVGIYFISWVICWLAYIHSPWKLCILAENLHSQAT